MEAKASGLIQNLAFAARKKHTSFGAFPLPHLFKSSSYLRFSSIQGQNSCCLCTGINQEQQLLNVVKEENKAFFVGGTTTSL